jgi:hypothetical protein
MVMAAYLLDNGTSIICESPMSDEEYKAYKSHPDTFFGIPLRQNQRANNELELYDFFYNSYLNNSKENILKLMKIESDNEKYINLSKEEVLRIYCEGLVYSVNQKSTVKT